MGVVTEGAWAEVWRPARTGDSCSSSEAEGGTGTAA